MILLIVARLVFGEFAYAMPHTSEAAHANAAAITQPHEVPCADHAGKPVEAKQPADSVGATATADHGTAHDTDCCKTAGCKCACVHISAIALPSFGLNVALFDQSRVPVAADGLMQDRLSVLLRPPA